LIIYAEAAMKGKIFLVIAVAVVLPLVAASPASAATEQHYHVQGDSLVEVSVEMDQHGPPGSDGTRYPAITYIGVTANRQPPSAPVVTPVYDKPLPPNEIISYEAVITVGVSWVITANMILPTWDGYAQASAAEQAEWTRYVAALRTHEQGHEQAAKDALANMNPPAQTTFTAKGTGSTPEAATANALAALAAIDAQIENERLRIVAAIDKASEDYDTATDHGVTQGATLT
jgi:predicted secreted Zn-dependent protease